jgi:hypothetical protein
MPHFERAMTAWATFIGWSSLALLQIEAIKRCVKPLRGRREKRWNECMACERERERERERDKRVMSLALRRE